MSKLIKNFIKDVAKDLSEQFDDNFNSKSFFDRPWPQTILNNNRGSLMNRTGDLIKSVQHPTITDNSIQWTSSLPYASIHNEGGEITVTAKMKAFFWVMYYKSAGAIQKGSKSKRNQILSAEAEQWKAMALKKVGDKIKIEQRQFIGDHPQVRASIERRWLENMKDLEEYMTNSLRQNK